MLGTIRYVVAFIVVALYPPAWLLWLAIHPFARYWRRIGLGWTYAILNIPVAAYVIAVVLARKRLLSSDLGTSGLTMFLAFVCLCLAFRLSLARRKQLTFKKLSGLPELSKSQYPGKLLTEGVYARVRNPRYIEVLLWVMGYTLFANYLVPYIVFLLSLPLMHCVVLLEERELSERFGPEYSQYRQNVPRYIPRRNHSL